MAPKHRQSKQKSANGTVLTSDTLGKHINLKSCDGGNSSHYGLGEKRMQAVCLVRVVLVTFLIAATEDLTNRHLRKGEFLIAD